MQRVVKKLTWEPLSVDQFETVDSMKPDVKAHLTKRRRDIFRSVSEGFSQPELRHGSENRPPINLE